MLSGDKVLVCITIQSNSMRLIEKGAKIAQECSGKLHILHIERGMSIFHNPQAAALLEELFKYGKELGGEVHFISDENVPERILSFIKDMEITKVVLGETMSNKLKKLMLKDINSYILNEAKDAEVMIIKRNSLASSDDEIAAMQDKDL